MCCVTGDPFFSGGLGAFLAATRPDGFDLRFEFGPLQDVPLQWATYYDVADEAGISRISGGIHTAFLTIFRAGSSARTQASRRTSTRPTADIPDRQPSASAPVICANNKNCTTPLNFSRCFT
ncbi:MAG: hypothetical protein LAT64_10900 [Phycisphaerales bacterium]|nr:hypothetical protein [Planctomycetota bacterium]MCH8509258.1 hypothetical protein [Phycisphaerales bacterium]